MTADLLTPVSGDAAPTAPAWITPLPTVTRLVTPRTVALRYAAVVGVAVVLGALHLKHRPSTVCPFRALTGLPCPFCGGTTAAVHLGHGDLGGALRASPLAVAVFASWPLLGAFRMPTWWQAPRNRWLVGGAVLVVAELWQLARFGLIHL